jgi:PAS domain-containing protein
VHWIAGHARLQDAGADGKPLLMNGRGRTRHHQPQDNRGKQSRFHALFDAAEDAVLIADDRRCVEANPAARKVPGLTPSEIAGRSIDEFVEGLPYTGVDAAWVQSRIGEKHGGRIWVESESGQASMLISHHR